METVVPGIGLAVIVALVLVGKFTATSAAARVDIHADDLRVSPIGLAKIAALRTSVTVSLARIDDVHTYTESGPKEFGGRGKCGIYRAPGTRAFLVVGRHRPVVVVECPGASYDRVVFSAADPDAVVADISRAMPSQLP
ncbi:MAG TPA: hypothetical protein VMZ22_04235 [Acidimicrobiales bacterium]|nr:hypothetical protein [Acidimicrobiales bacterium]